ncbi:MAG: FAD-dependent oxidoreductase [Dysgonomonas sp.]|nr:FAD-dependent oxidoreductase [Dysgonomonas sp.]
MKKLISYLLFSVITLSAIAQTTDYDLVILGGTPGGIMAAIAASREGKTSVILERTEHIGGLPVNGLGATDIATKGATTGLFKEFVDRILTYYTEKYGADSKQVRDCSQGYHFEPKVAAQAFQEMLEIEDSNITVLKMRQFDVYPSNIKTENGNIKSIRVLNRNTKKQEEYTGKIFVDATYEGDLGGAAGVPYSIGRESKNEYNEIGTGKIYKLWKGPELEGTTHEGDNALQAYNYRLCLTNDPANKLLPDKPKKYNRSEYISLIEDVLLGRHAGADMLNVTKEMQETNKQYILSGGKTKIPGDPWGMWKLSSMTSLPNSKMDANNQHMALISTDLPEENQEWPTADWKWRDKFAERLKSYILGLIWFAQNDRELPAQFREAAREWGLAKDEYLDNEYFPRQVYVREGRRFHGEYFFTANDALPIAEGKRPPLHSNSITASHYALDSHAVKKREDGKIALDGFFSYPSAVYTVPYGVIVPQKINNLLIPVPVSGTHVGFSTLRMEPCWMALGQASGIAASIAIDKNIDIRKVPIDQIQDKLIKEKVTLIYFKDIRTDNPHSEMVQYMGLRGYLPEWEARLDDKIDQSTVSKWSKLSGIDINMGDKSRKEVLNSIYSLIR